MKIIKGVGEYLLPRWLRNELRPVLTFTGAGASLLSGSLALAARGWAYLGDRLDTWERLGACAAGVYVVGYGCLHAPHIAQFAVPAAAVAWCAAAWCVAPTASAPHQPDEEEHAEQDPQDVTDLVRDLIGDDRGILLTALRKPLHAASTRAVREVLAGAGIRVREGVRTGGGNGPGVHRDDLAAPSPPLGTPLGDLVVAGEDANTNANNMLRVESREGMTIISDPADRHRAHSLKKAP
jgi:hypothetical protein